MFVWLMVQLALIRTLSICFPMNNGIGRLRNNFGFSFLLFLFWFVVHSWPYMFVRSYRMKDHLAYKGCQPNGVDRGKPLPLNVLALPSVYGSDYTRALEDAEGYIRIFTAIIYSILVVIMIVKLRMISRKRRSLNSKESEKSDHTTMLVILMTLTFLISEGYPAVLALYMLSIRNPDIEYFQQYQTFFGYLKQTSAQDFVRNFRVLNSASHVFLCYLMSSQYRTTVHGLVCCCKNDLNGTIMVQPSTTSKMENEGDRWVKRSATY
uniref:G_PROTEIN_RECEP_F1_2 domain-containing protein n=1 Tax=Caenorhabditis tropicalis TaxID=1561998 RepID=A0A1I7T7N2_9PELO